MTCRTQPVVIHHSAHEKHHHRKKPQGRRRSLRLVPPPSSVSPAHHAPTADSLSLSPLTADEITQHTGGKSMFFRGYYIFSCGPTITAKITAAKLLRVGTSYAYKWGALYSTVHYSVYCTRGSGSKHLQGRTGLIFHSPCRIYLDHLTPAAFLIVYSTSSQHVTRQTRPRGSPCPRSSGQSQI